MLRKIRLRINHEIMFVHRLEEIPDVLPGDYPKVRKLEIHEVDVLLDVWKVDLNKMRKRLQNDCICYVAFYEGKCVAYRWLQLSGPHFVQQLGRTYMLPKKQAVLFHSRVSTDYRGRSIGKYMLSIMLADLKKMKYKKLWGYLKDFNIANKKGLTSSGFEEYAHWKSLEYYHDKFLGITPFQFPLN